MLKVLITLCLSLFLAVAQAEGPQQGAYLGAKPVDLPGWFKLSFLDFEDDVAEAARNGKRVMLYFYQDGCPYCAQLVEENFTDPKILAYLREHFDGIDINMWGDKEIVSIGGKQYTEKTFAAALKVQYTPTLLFLTEEGKGALRLNGYYPKDKFFKALRYVAEKQESKVSFNEFMMADEPPIEGSLMSEDFFSETTDLKALLAANGKPLAVYFESGDCEECEFLHDRILSDGPTRKLAQSLPSVQLDVHSDAQVVTPDGQQTTAKDYAAELNIGYTPSVVFFDKNGKEVHRIEGFLKTFHFQSSVAYVLEGVYLEQPSFQRYIAARGEALREQGYDTDIWGYESFHPADTEVGH